jgi:hypothetical protein
LRFNDENGRLIGQFHGYVPEPSSLADPVDTVVAVFGIDTARAVGVLLGGGQRPTNREPGSRVCRP